MTMTKEKMDEIGAREQTAADIITALRVCNSRDACWEGCHTGQEDCPYGETVMDCTDRLFAAVIAYMESTRRDIPALLEALEEARAKANKHVCAYCSQVFEGGTSADTLREHIDVCPLHPIADVRAERDHYKARAEAAERRAGALERALNWPGCANPECHWYTPCDTCRVDSDFCDHLCNDEGATDLDMSEACPYWYFDQARFEGAQK